MSERFKAVLAISVRGKFASCNGHLGEKCTGEIQHLCKATFNASKSEQSSVIPPLTQSFKSGVGEIFVLLCIDFESCVIVERVPISNRDQITSSSIECCRL